ncbi:DUF1146 family protein [Listeria sp. PSOL-1]|uniref:DUF1146 family protein n=1 Tax=Listeria sp. PSOL-1 TaxID=1844999 RepID=UPI0013D4EAA6|nr:DUF1146 family protein [Listeria sp. PSOL-1]
MYNIVMQDPMIVIISHLIFIIITFWALQALNYEKFLKKNKVMQARLLFAILAVVIGYLLSSFFLEYLSASKQLLTFL